MWELKNVGMKKYIKICTIVLIFVIINLLDSYSKSVTTNIRSLVGTFLFFTVIAVLMTLCATIFLKGSFKQRFLKALPLSYIAIGLVYIIGYFTKTFVILWV